MTPSERTDPTERTQPEERHTETTRQNRTTVADRFEEASSSDQFDEPSKRTEELRQQRREKRQGRTQQDQSDTNTQREQAAEAHLANLGIPADQVSPATAAYTIGLILSGERYRSLDEKYLRELEDTGVRIDMQKVFYTTMSILTLLGTLYLINPKAIHNFFADSHSLNNAKNTNAPTSITDTDISNNIPGFTPQSATSQPLYPETTADLPADSDTDAILDIEVTQDPKYVQELADEISAANQEFYPTIQEDPYTKALAIMTAVQDLENRVGENGVVDPALIAAIASGSEQDIQEMVDMLVNKKYYIGDGEYDPYKIIAIYFGEGKKAEQVKAVYRFIKKPNS